MSRLLEAVFANNLAKIANLLDRDPDRIKDTEAFCQAIGWGRREAVKLLVQRGADLNAKDRNGNHPLSMACHSPALDLFDELVYKGSDPRLATGLAAAAARSDRADVLKHLRHVGFDLNEPNARGIRPLDAAVGMGHLQAVEYLLSENVDTSGLDVTKPFVPWKGALPDAGVMEEIRSRIIAKMTGSGAPPHGGPATRAGDSEVPEGPPSAS
jgi:ankyrin repeat protein